MNVDKVSKEQKGNDVNHVLAPVFNFQFTWDETPVEMKQEFADLNELDLNNKSQEYDMRNMWHHARYCRGIE
jgi:hypothetical protein